MGKKEKQTTCPICNKKLSFLKATLKDGVKVCSKHVAIEAGILSNDVVKQSTVEDIKEQIRLKQESQEQFEKEVDTFVPTKQIGNFIAFDDNQKKWATLSSFRGKIQQIYSYDDIIDFELLEDGTSVASGGLGRALVGGALFGGAGAIVGGVTGKKKTKDFCNSLRLKITINDISNPVVYINFIESKTKKNGMIYKSIANAAQECLSVLQIICDNNEKHEELQPQNSLADEIMKYKKLLDMGAITQDEFEKKKEELLKL